MCVHSRVVTALLLVVTPGAYLTSSTILHTISTRSSRVLWCWWKPNPDHSTSCKLPQQLVLPLAPPTLLAILVGPLLTLTLVQVG